MCVCICDAKDLPLQHTQFLQEQLYLFNLDTNTYNIIYCIYLYLFYIVLNIDW